MNPDDLTPDDLFHLTRWIEAAVEWAWNGAGEIGRRAWIIPFVKKLCTVAPDRLRHPRSQTIRPPILVNKQTFFTPVVHNVSASLTAFATLSVQAQVIPSSPRC